jgi:glutamine cyclotransferase
LGSGRRLAAGIATGAIALVAGVAPLGHAAPSTTPVFGYRVVASWLHDPTAYTEGLALERGVLFESTGLNGRSTLRTVAIRTGRILRSVRLPKRFYGEGITVLRGRVYQLTLVGGAGFVYDAKSLRKLRTFSFTGEGWGLTRNGGLLVISDGTDTLRVLDPSTFAVRRTVTVRDQSGARVTGLNELELVDGSICANVYPTDRVACVDPRSGRVRYWIDLAGLLPQSLRPGDEEAVVNGIAWGGHPGRILVTGKLWPRLYEIRLVRTS